MTPTMSAKNETQPWESRFNVAYNEYIGESERLHWYIGINYTQNGDVRVFIAKVDKSRGFVRNFTTIPTNMLESVINALTNVKAKVNEYVEEARKQKVLKALEKAGLSLEDLKQLLKE